MAVSADLVVEVAVVDFVVVVVFGTLTALLDELADFAVSAVAWSSRSAVAVLVLSFYALDQVNAKRADSCILPSGVVRLKLAASGLVSFVRLI